MKFNYFLAICASFIGQWTKAQFTVYNTSNSGLTDNYCWFINESPTGKVWVGTTSTGASTFDGATWANYNTNNSGISSNYITPIAFDIEGTWLGSAYTSPGGLSKFNGTTWTSYNTNNSNI
jgi:ligand-binding sensor domain-containing protein